MRRSTSSTSAACRKIPSTSIPGTFDQSLKIKIKVHKYYKLVKNKDFLRILPCSSTYLRAFSKKDGVPSISSNASKTGLPRTTDFAGERSFAVGKQKQEKEVDLCY